MLRGTIKGTPQKGCKAKVSSSEGTTTSKRRRSQTLSQNVNALGQSNARKRKKLKYEPQQRLNKQPTFCYHSNIAGIVKLVGASKLKDEHLQHLQKTPFWLLLDAMRKTDLNQHEFQKCNDIVMRIIQTFVPEKSAFMISGGKKSLDVSHGPRLPTDFIQRKCPKIARINLKTIKELLMKVLPGNTTQDHQDVAKLLCLYVCGKLFFATSGETVGWGFVRVVEDLENMKAYDWAGAICTTLMESIKGFYSKPKKVTGCVTALL
ncbi:unnamed protein product [Camellia sinensis]